MCVLLAYGFPSHHALLCSLMRHAELISHDNADLALAAVRNSDVSAGLLFAGLPHSKLSALTDRWHLHPQVRLRPMILVGTGPWNTDEAGLCELLSADTYLPMDVGPEILLSQVRSLSGRFRQLSDSRYSLADDTPQSRNGKIEEILRRSSYLPTISVENLASEAGMSLSGFQRSVKRLTGLSPIEYVNRLRLERAHQMLVTRQGSVSDIAYQTGFNSVAYFCKMFKRQYSITPGQVLEE